VWKGSLADYVAKRRQGDRSPRAANRTEAHAGVAADIASPRRGIYGHERRLRASAQHLKVAADLLRDQLRELLATAIHSAAAVESLARDIVRNDDHDYAALEQHSDALTNS
jgi:hypothetical protein